MAHLKTRTKSRPPHVEEPVHQIQSRLPRALPSANGNALPAQPNKVVASSRVLPTLENDTFRDPHALPSQIEGASQAKPDEVVANASRGPPRTRALPSQWGASQAQPDEVVATSGVLPTLVKDASRGPPWSQKVSPTSKNGVAQALPSSNGNASPPQPEALPSPNGSASPPQPDEVVAISRVLPTLAKDASRGPPWSLPDENIASSSAQPTAAVILRVPPRSPKASPATTTSDKKRRFPDLNHLPPRRPPTPRTPWASTAEKVIILEPGPTEPNLQREVQRLVEAGYHVWSSPGIALISILDLVAAAPQPTRWPAKARAEEIMRLPASFGNHLRLGTTLRDQRPENPSFQKLPAPEQRQDGSKLIGHLNSEPVFSPNGKKPLESEQLVATPDPATITDLIDDEGPRRLTIAEAVSIMTRS